jgi:hypothetical protein
VPPYFNKNAIQVYIEPIKEHDAAFIDWYHETNLNHLSNLSIASYSVLLHGCSISNLFTCQF